MSNRPFVGVAVMWQNLTRQHFLLGGLRWRNGNCRRWHVYMVESFQCLAGKRTVRYLDLLHCTPALRTVGEFSSALIPRDTAYSVTLYIRGWYIMQVLFNSQQHSSVQQPPRQLVGLQVEVGLFEQYRRHWCRVYVCSLIGRFLTTFTISRLDLVNHPAVYNTDNLSPLLLSAGYLYRLYVILYWDYDWIRLQSIRFVRG